MHPPLDRPHPDCADVIEALRECHINNSKWRFWACNDAKYALDRCFKKEKKDMLKRMNADFAEDRAAEAELTGKMGWEDHYRQQQKRREEEQNGGQNPGREK